MHHETWTGAHISMFEWGRENTTQNRYSQYWITCFVGRHRRCCFFCGRRLEWCRQFIVKKHNQTDCVERWSQTAAREMSVVKKMCEKGDGGEWNMKGHGVGTKVHKTTPSSIFMFCSIYNSWTTSTFSPPNIQRAFFLSRLLTSYVLGVLAPCGRHFW